MRIRWFKHGKWPKWLVGLHHYTIASFILLTASGIALYLPALHALLIPYLPIIYKIHIFLGLIFAITLVTPFLRILPKSRRIWKFDWTLPLLFGVPLVVTGILLWGGAVFPALVTSHAFTWHGILTIGFGAWILIHAFYKALGIRPDAQGSAGRVDPERRLFLRWAGFGVLGTLAIMFIDPVAILRAMRSGASNDASNVASSGIASSSGVQRFGAYYTVVNGYPFMALDAYHLRVDGDVSSPITLSWSKILSLTPYSEVKDFHCVTGWSVSDVHWRGVHLSQLVRLVKPAANVKYVNFYSFDGKYTESLKLSEALDPSVLLAYELDGRRLEQEQGAPLRLVVPKMYGYKSIKWLNRVEFSKTPITGYWEKYGYSNEAYL